MQQFGNYIGSFTFQRSSAMNLVRPYIVNDVVSGWIPPPKTQSLTKVPISVETPIGTEAIPPSLVQPYQTNLVNLSVHKHHGVLLKLRGTWPFDFFHNELLIEDTRVILHERYFFSDWNDMARTIMVSNLACCEVTQSLFFAQLMLQDKFGDVMTIQWLKRSDALMAKEVIDALMMKEKVPIGLAEDDLAIRMQHLRLLGHADISS